MKKIIFFAYTLEVGGAEKVLCDYINVLKDKYKIDVCLLQNIGEFKANIPKDVNVIQLKKNNVSYIPFRYFSFWRKHVINKIVNEGKYDIAVGFLEGRSATWVADIRRPIRKIAFVHNDVKKFDIGISRSEIIKSYNNMDLIVAVSNMAKDSMSEKYHIPNEKIKVLYNLIDEEDILKKANEKVEKNDVFTFVNVGKMRPQKRQDRLIEIAKDLKKEGYKFKIQIVGNGPEEENIKKLIKSYGVEDVVELVGLQLNPYKYMKNGDAFVLSSDFEGFGIVVKEALLLKKLVISTAVTGVTEVLENGRYGILTDVDTEDLENKMRDVLENRIDTKNILKELGNYDCGNQKIIEELEKILNG